LKQVGENKNTQMTNLEKEAKFAAEAEVKRMEAQKKLADLEVKIG